MLLLAKNVRMNHSSESSKCSTLSMLAMSCKNVNCMAVKPAGTAGVVVVDVVEDVVLCVEVDVVLVDVRSVVVVVDVRLVVVVRVVRVVVGCVVVGVVAGCVVVGVVGCVDIGADSDASAVLVTSTVFGVDVVGAMLVVVAEGGVVVTGVSQCRPVKVAGHTHGCGALPFCASHCPPFMHMQMGGVNTVVVLDVVGDVAAGTVDMDIIAAVVLGAEPHHGPENPVGHMHVTVLFDPP